MSQPGGASLDGEPPASTLPRPSRRPEGRVRGASRSWRSPDSWLLRVAPPGGGLFDHSPSSRHRLWRPLSRSVADAALLPHPLRLESRGPRPPPSRQRPRLSSDQDAFHRRVLPPPVAHGACAHARGITRSPPPARCSRAVAFATANRLPAPLRALSGRLSARRQRARPAVFRPLDRAPLVDFCNQTQPASTTARTTRFPPRCLRLVLPRRRPAGSAAWRRFRSRGPVHVAGSKGRALAGQGPSPSQWLHDDGPPLAFARGALAATRVTLSGRMTSELYPTRIRSDTSRRESTAPSTGEFDDAR